MKARCIRYSVITITWYTIQGNPTTIDDSSLSQHIRSRILAAEFDCRSICDSGCEGVNTTDQKSVDVEVGTLKISRTTVKSVDLATMLHNTISASWRLPQGRTVLQVRFTIFTDPVTKEELTECSICGNELKYHHSTTTLQYHVD